MFGYLNFNLIVTLQHTSTQHPVSFLLYQTTFIWSFCKCNFRPDRSVRHMCVGRFHWTWFACYRIHQKKWAQLRDRLMTDCFNAKSLIASSSFHSTGQLQYPITIITIITKVSNIVWLGHLFVFIFIYSILFLFLFFDVLKYLFLRDEKHDVPFASFHSIDPRKCHHKNENSWMENSMRYTCACACA